MLSKHTTLSVLILVWFCVQQAPLLLTSGFWRSSGPFRKSGFCLDKDRSASQHDDYIRNNGSSANLFDYPTQNRILFNFADTLEYAIANAGRWLEKFWEVQKAISGGEKIIQCLQQKINVQLEHAGSVAVNEQIIEELWGEFAVEEFLKMSK